MNDDLSPPGDYEKLYVNAVKRLGESRIKKINEKVHSEVYKDVASYTEPKEIEYALKYCVKRIREGKSLNQHLMNFIADGIEAWLNDKQPWPLKRGQDTKIVHYFKIYCLYRFQGVKRKVLANKYGYKDERSIRDAVTSVENHIKSFHKSGRTATILEVRRLCQTLPDEIKNSAQLGFFGEVESEITLQEWLLEKAPIIKTVSCKQIEWTGKKEPVHWIPVD